VARTSLPRLLAHARDRGWRRLPAPLLGGQHLQPR
jgi:hypothetical protein